MFYEFVEFKRNVIAIYLHYKRKFEYNNKKPVKCIWGFYNTKTDEYFSPINSSKIGSKVDIRNTRNYSAMPLNLSPLESFFV